jgi:hypothetical protein
MHVPVQSHQPLARAPLDISKPINFAAKILLGRSHDVLALFAALTSAYIFGHTTALNFLASFTGLEHTTHRRANSIHLGSGDKLCHLFVGQCSELPTV